MALELIGLFLAFALFTFIGFVVGYTKGREEQNDLYAIEDT